MENIDRLVQLVTERLLEKIEDKSERRLIYLVGSASTRQIASDCGFDLTDDVGEANLILVDSLSVDALLRLANLCPTTIVETDIITALLTGKKVMIASDSFQLETYKRTASSLLYRNLLKQKETLERYGVSFYEREQLLSLLAPRSQKSLGFESRWRKEESDFTYLSQKEQNSTNASKALGKRKLITEAKLKAMGLCENDTFTVEKGMIVTALAKDYLNRHHITIVE